MSAELLWAVPAALGSAAWLFPGGLLEAPGAGLAPEDVSPGVLGFLVTLALVLACIPIFVSMTRKLRGVKHRDQPGEPGGDAGPGGDEPRSGTGAGTGPGSDAG